MRTSDLAACLFRCAHVLWAIAVVAPALGSHLSSALLPPVLRAGGSSLAQLVGSPTVHESKVVCVPAARIRVILAAGCTEQA